MHVALTADYLFLYPKVPKKTVTASVDDFYVIINYPVLSKIFE